MRKPMKISALGKAVRKQKRFFDFKSEEMHFKNARYSQYRVWCLQEIQNLYKQLPKKPKKDIKKTLEKFHCQKPLWEQSDLPLDNKQEKNSLFGPIEKCQVFMKNLFINMIKMIKGKLGE